MATITFGLMATTSGETAVVSGGRVTGLFPLVLAQSGYLGTGSEPIAEVSGSLATGGSIPVGWCLSPRSLKITKDQ